MSVIDGLKTAGKVLQEAGKIEQYQQILDAQQRMLEMQATIADLTEENRILKTQLTTRDAMVYENNAYYTNPTDDSRDGPFCSHCWDVDGKTVRLKPSLNNRAFSSCPSCKNQFQTNPSYQPVFTSRRPPTSYR